jgi:hypothetical protein
MEEENTYEINSNTDGGLKEKPLRKESFQERREAIVECEIEHITTQIASNMQANLDPEKANFPVETPSHENPLSLDILGPPENIKDEDIEYLVEARRNRGGFTKRRLVKCLVK